MQYYNIWQAQPHREHADSRISAPPKNVRDELALSHCIATIPSCNVCRSHFKYNVMRTMLRWLVPCLLLVTAVFGRELSGIRLHQDCTDFYQKDSYGVITKDHIRVFVPDFAGLPFGWDRYSRWLPYARSSVYANCSMDAPLGSPIHGHGAWNTNQFCVGMWFHRQLTTSPLRVHSLQQADIVYVPVFALDLHRMEWRNESSTKSYIAEFGAEWEWKAAVSEFYRQAPKLLPALGQKPHVIVLPRVEVDFQKEGSLLDEKLHGGIIKRFTFLTIEPAIKWASMQPQQFYALNRIGIPYPSLIHCNAKMIFHVWAHYVSANWQRHNVPIHEISNADSIKAQRQLLVYGTWSSRRELRKQLRMQCKQPAYDEDCVMLDTPTFHEEEAVQAVKLARSSWFCMQPPGDTYSRRSLYTCLSAGSIPVVFGSHWKLLLPFSDVLDSWKMMYDVNLLRAAIDMGTVHIVDHLKGMAPAERLSRHEYVAHHRHLFQYMLDPVHKLLTVNSSGSIHCLDDAFTASMKAVVRNACRRGMLSPQRCVGVAMPQEPDPS